VNGAGSVSQPTDLEQRAHHWIPTPDFFRYREILHGNGRTWRRVPTVDRELDDRRERHGLISVDVGIFVRTAFGMLCFRSAR